MNPYRRKLVVLGSAALLSPRIVSAQGRRKVHRMGCLWFGSPATAGDLVAMIMDALRDVGYVEGKHLAVDTRWAEGKEERFPNLAAELVARRPDIIVTSPLTSSIKAAQQATSTIPIVMIGNADPVGFDLVVSLAHPGGNTTGISSMSLGLLAKQVEILHTMVPGAKRIAVLAVSEVNTAVVLKEIREAAKGFGLNILTSMVQASEEFGQAVTLMTKEKVEAVVVIPHKFFLFHRKKLADLLLKARLPAIYSLGSNVDVGGLLSYGASLPHLFRRAADYVDKILKGAKPAELPVQQPTEFELVVNLKTAKALGITVPKTIMGRADRVIE